MMWRHWTDEYLQRLNEQNRLKHAKKPSAIAVGEIMLIKEDERNHGKRKIGIMTLAVTVW